MKVIISSKLSYIKKGGEKRMKHHRIFLTLGVIVFALATMAFMANTWATENVRNSKHNLSVNPNIAGGTDIGTTEVCIFCHTPHGGDTDVGGGAAPLWNRDMSGMTESASFTPYRSPNFDEIGDTPGYPKGVSLACLSCHDGSIAFDSLVNFPGSGSSDSITFPAAGGNNLTTDGKMKNSPDVPSGAAGEFPMLGINLSNDHPVSMEIPCNADPQFDNAVGALGRPNQICNNLDQPELNAGRVSPLYRGGNSSVLPADKRDHIRAYPTNGDGKPYIECASCHNPHEENNAVGDTLLAGFVGPARDTRFLRYPSFAGTTDETAVGGTSVLDVDRNAGSLLCLSCHQK